MTHDEPFDQIPEASTLGRKRCSECEGWRIELTDGVCSFCLAPPVVRKRLLPPRYYVFNPTTLESIDFDQRDKAEKVAAYVEGLVMERW